MENGNVRRISSRLTFYHKRVFPAVWFGSVLCVLLITVVAGIRSFRLSFLGAWLVLLLMLPGGYLVMRHLVLDMVDDVWDAGDHLIVKNRHEEVRIPISDIVNVDSGGRGNPSRVTLMLRQPCRFGKQVSFAPKGARLFPFAKNPLVEELITRIDVLRHS